MPRRTNGSGNRKLSDTGTPKEFKNVGRGGKKMSVAQWEAELRAAREARRGTTGVYNPKTGQREYGPRYTGRRKNMRGRSY